MGRVTTLTERGAGTSVRVSPRYRVLLHNDDVNTMDHVVRTLLRVVPAIGADRARRVMREAHERGVAVVIVCMLEHAELYRDGLTSCGLTATVESE